jgi:hypothetical protein
VGTLPTLPRVKTKRYTAAYLQIQCLTSFVIYSVDYGHAINGYGAAGQFY